MEIYKENLWEYMDPMRHSKGMVGRRASTDFTYMRTNGRYQFDTHLGYIRH